MTGRGWFVVLAAAAFVLGALQPTPAGLRPAPLDRYGQEIVSGTVPYRDFSLEYPPGALPPIVLPALEPGNGDTVAFTGVEAVLGALLVLTVARLVRTAPRWDFVVAVASVAAIPWLLGPVVFLRFDLWPTLLTVLAILTMLESRVRLAGASLAVAVAAKLFPLVLMVPLAIEAARRRHLGRAIVACVAAVGVIVLPFVALAPGGVRYSLERQLHHGLQLESVGGSVIALAATFDRSSFHTVFSDGAWEIHGPGALATIDVMTFIGLVSVAVVSLLLWRRRSSLDLVLAAGALVSLVLVFSKVMSPQYLVWSVPFAVSVRGRTAYVAAVMLALTELLTRFLYPSHYDALVALHGTEVAMLAFRNALVVATAGVLVNALVLRSRSERA